jgi:hypothetical protein
VTNAFLAMFNNDAAAETLINASPIRYRLVSEAGESTAEEKEKVFELHLSQSMFDHEHYIATDALFGPWKPVDRKYNFLAMSLEIPRGVMSAGLRDWDTEGLKWRNAGNEGLVPGFEESWARDGVNIQWRIQMRRKWRKEKMLRESVMGGLKKFVEEKEASDLAASTAEEQREEPAFGGPRVKLEGFGAWPGKDIKDIERERALEKEREQDPDRIRQLELEMKQESLRRFEMRQLKKELEGKLGMVEKRQMKKELEGKPAMVEIDPGEWPVK